MPLQRVTTRFPAPYFPKMTGSTDKQFRTSKQCYVPLKNPLSMNVFIDQNHSYKRDPLQGVFTSLVLGGLVIARPADQFFFTKPDPLLQNLPNARFSTLGKTGITWFDRYRLLRRVKKADANRLLSCPPGNEIGHWRIEAVSNGRAASSGMIHWGSAGIPLVLPGVMSPLSWAAEESIKTQYTGGKSFFLFIGNLGESQGLVALLRAFSVFKKWQQSNMQLVLAGPGNRETDALQEKLEAYKHRQDVVLLENLPMQEMVRLIAASYAMLYPAATAFPLACYSAAQWGKAIVSTDSPRNRATGVQAEWVSPDRITEGFSTAMIAVYRDEQKLQSLTHPPADPGSWAAMLGTLWQQIAQPAQEIG